jgi:hypothetical protein
MSHVGNACLSSAANNRYAMAMKFMTTVGSHNMDTRHVFADQYTVAPSRGWLGLLPDSAKSLSRPSQVLRMVSSTIVSALEQRHAGVPQGGKPLSMRVSRVQVIAPFF